MSAAADFRVVNIPEADMEELIELLDDLEILPKTLDALLHSVLGPQDVSYLIDQQFVSEEVMIEKYLVPAVMFDTALTPARILHLSEDEFRGWMPVRGYGGTKSGFDYYAGEGAPHLMERNVQFYRTDTHKLVSFKPADTFKTRCDALQKLCS